jgi:transportin-3
MSTWQRPIECLLEKFTKNSNLIKPLLLTISYVPEEIDAKYLRLGENRRREVLKELESCTPVILNFLQTCLMSDTQMSSNIHLDVISCFTAWVKMNTITLEEAASSAVFAYSFQLLANPAMNDEKSLDIASDCVCAVLESIDLAKTSEESEKNVFFGIMQLHQAYIDSVTNEDADKSMVLCRIFTVVAETYLHRMIQSKPDEPHYSLQVLDSLVACVGHFDYEVAQVTFNVWYKLSEELYNKDNEQLTRLFERYIERLIEALFKHCQLDADHEGLIDSDNQFFVSQNNSILEFFY